MQQTPRLLSTHRSSFSRRHPSHGFVLTQGMHPEFAAWVDGFGNLLLGLDRTAA
jgi:hypothetical protein